MPSTVNGIGTTYHGRTSVSTTAGVCESCRRTTTLTSYETREWVCVLFIPVIPLRRWRILAQCSACRRHRRAPLEAYENAVEDAAAPLLAKFEAGDAAAGLELAGVYLGFQSIEKAAAHADALVLAHPANAEARFVTGIVLGRRGRYADAARAYEKALELAPGEERYLGNLAPVLAAAGEHAAAAARYEELLARKPGNPVLLHGLARAHAALGQDEDAARVLDQLYAASPAARNDRPLRKWAIALKARAGLPLAAPELALVRARRRNRIVATGLVGVLLVGAPATLFILDRTARLLVDNGAPAQAVIRLDGRKWLTLAANGYEQTTIPRGHHVVEATAGAWSEKIELDAEPAFFQNVLGSATGVLDVFKHQVYIEHDVVYGNLGPPTEPVYHVCEGYFGVARADHVMEEAPSSIHTSGGGERRTVLRRLPETTPAQVAGWLLSHGRDKDAVAYLEREIERSSDDLQLFYFLKAAGAGSGQDDAVDAWLDARRTEDPASVNFHRFHQDVLRSSGRQSDLEREYDAFAAQTNGSALGWYLRGRAAASPVLALECYEKAIAADEAFPWAHLGAGSEKREAGEWDAAIEHYRRYLRLRGPKGEREALWEVLALARRWSELEAELDGPADHGDRRALQAYGRFLILTEVPGARWDAWLAAQDARFRGERWQRELAIERARFEGQRERAETLLRDLGAKMADGFEPVEPRLAGIALQGGDPAEAGRVLEAVFSQPHVGIRAVHAALLLGIALEWLGEGERAMQWYGRAEEAATEYDDHELSRFLLHRAPLSSSEERHRTCEGRSVSAVARALRAEDPGERARQLEVALHFGAWDLDDAFFLVRGQLAKAPPPRR